MHFFDAKSTTKKQCVCIDILEECSIWSNKTVLLILFKISLFKKHTSNADWTVRSFWKQSTGTASQTFCIFPYILVFPINTKLILILETTQVLQYLEKHWRILCLPFGNRFRLSSVNFPTTPTLKMTSSSCILFDQNSFLV